MSGVITAALRELVAAGVEGEALVSAIARIEAASAPGDEQAARRRAKDRDRQRAKRLRKSADICGQDADVAASDRSAPLTERPQTSAESAEIRRHGSLLNDPQPLLPNVEVNLNLSPKEKDTTCPKRKGSKWPSGSFNLFWSAYPNKVGKKAAIRSFERLERSGEVTAEDFFAGLERYKVSKPEHHEWKHPATWLNQGCWMDEYAPPAAPSPPMNGFHRPVQDFGAIGDKINAEVAKRKAARDAMRH